MSDPNHVRKRIFAGISFFKKVVSKGERYDTRIVKNYFPAFIDLLEDYFGLKGVSEPTLFEQKKGDDIATAEDAAELFDSVVESEDEVQTGNPYKG